MAHTVHTDSTGTYVEVVSGDTLSGIAYEFRNSYEKKTWQQLATLNGLSNANLIYPKQKIYLTKSSSGSPISSSATKDPNITSLGVQSTDSGTLFATWTWSKHSDTENYETKWEYDLGDKTGSSILWYVDKGSTEERYSTWSIKKGVKSVKFSVKPISKKKSDGKSTYFEADWSSVATWTNTLPLPKPTNLNVDMDGCKLTATLSGLETSCPEATHVAFEVVKDNKTVIHTAEKCTNKIQTGYASYNWTVDPGAEYKVRCYAYTDENKSGKRSDWTEYSDNYPSTPAKLSGFKTIKAVDKNSAYLEWVAAATAKSYDIEWYDDKTNVDLTSPTGSTSIEKQIACKIQNLVSGHEYFFRIRAVNEEGESDWSSIQSIVIGTKPSAPTTWSSTTTVVAGEDLVLYWVHNSEDESSQSIAELKLDIIVDGSITSKTYTVRNSTDDELKDKTSFCTINTKTGYISWTEDDGLKQFYLGVKFEENVQIKWQVKTRGIAAEYSDYSEPRTVDVYSEPKLTLSMGAAKYYLVEKVNGEYIKTYEVIDIPIGSALVGAFTTGNEQVYQYVDSDGDVTYYCCEITDLGLDDPNVSDLPIVKTFPFYISAVPGPKSQSPIGYHLSISANTAYETTDNIGNVKMVGVGEQVYSKYFDIKHDLLVEFTPGNIDLENNINYTITCTVSMNSGLTAESSKGFTVDWDDMVFSPNAEVGIYSDTYSATIRPYCEDRRIEYRKVELSGKTYTVTETVYDFIYGEPVKNAVTTTGERVYKGVTADGEDIYFCEFDVVTSVTDVYLAVYRREFDGSFTELATMLDGANNVAITDPHPALDYARYRIVATSKSTGEVSYYDLPGVSVNGKAVIIQWSEEWTTFESLEENRSAEPTWSGSMLSLPYNIDVSDNTDPEVELVEYIGRKHPVTYYGTQRGQKSTWNVTIAKDDEETLYALRRLAMWMDDVYVREPSGSGYWANIKVSFSQKHRDLTIPVTLNITRVEGGI